ncbi:hypothetical protein ACJMK2_039797 [Sinanodonta woodiana]|uniref:EF-hand domain-containing protein n=1 Tax=Sinanodonta woodiana TaxID=1069815 RepID=A0ABD3WH43_SINWO
MICLLLFVLPVALSASMRQAVHNATHGHHDPVATFQHHLHLETEKLWEHMDFNHDGNFGRDDLQHFIHDYDTNQDGHVEKHEFKQYWTEVLTLLFVIHIHTPDGTTC